MDIAYPQPKFPKGTSIFVSQPAIPSISSSSVISAMQDTALSSKANYNTIFEDNLKSYFKVKTACSVSNGYSSLFVILKSIKLLKSSKRDVIIPDATMVAVENAVLDNDLNPVLVDNEKDHLNPSVEMITSKVTKDTIAIIVTHTYGVPIPQFENLVEFCFENKIFLIEDIAEAIGVQYKGQFLGTFGHFASASLYANKLITCGDGGFIFSKLSDLDQNMPLESTWKSIINHGFSSGFHFNHLIQSGNYRINGLGAAFICNFPEYIDSFIKKRNQIDQVYRENLPLSHQYTLMEDNTGGPNTPWVFAMTFKNKEILIEVRQHLANFGIETRPFFKPIHTQNSHMEFISKAQSFPNSVQQYQTGLYLPTYQELTEPMQKYITLCINKFFTQQNPPHFQTFPRTQKKIIDLLSQDQIIEVISNLTNSIVKKQYPLFNSEVQQKLRSLGQAIDSSEIIQIKQKQKFLLKSQPEQNDDKKLNKILVCRQNDKNLGKKWNKINSYLMEIAKQWSEYFEIERCENSFIIWQKQYSKEKSIQDHPEYLCQEKQYLIEIAKATAQALWNFHSVSKNIKESYLKEKADPDLKEQLQTIKQQILALNFIVNCECLRRLVLSFLDQLILRQSKTQKGPLRLIHNSLTTEKMIYQDEKVIKLFDFENATIQECLFDLVLHEEKYNIQQFNELIIDSYLNFLPTSLNKQQLRQRVEIIRMLKIFSKIRIVLQNYQEQNLEKRDLLRKLVSQAVYLQGTNLSEKEKEYYFQFERQQYTMITQGSIPERKWNCSKEMGWSHHCGGWKFIEKLIREHFHSEYAQNLFVSALQKSLFDNQITDPISTRWSGFIHNVPLKEENQCTNLQILFNDSNFQHSLINCQGIYCLTSQIKERFSSEYPQIPCQKISYALTPPKKLFLSSCLEKEQLKIVHIGQYLRNVDFFLKTRVKANCHKYILCCEGIHPKMNLNSTVEEIEGAKWLNYIEEDEYQTLLSESILLLNLRGAGGCTTVVECIARNTPIFINRLPALEEYLGKEYPLFYQSKQHLQAMFANNFKNHVLQGHHYLLNLNKTKLYPQHFVQSLQNSFIYQREPIPNNQKKQFQEYDISILLISYKRQENIKQIVNSLSKQNFKGTIELIIWNNNRKYSLNFIEKQFKGSFGNLVVIQSTFNYYCFVRSAIANLARGKMLLFTDDDILPRSNFVEEYMLAYHEVQKQYQHQNVVVTFKGNSFHGLHPKFDSQFWTNFDNVSFVSPQDSQQQIHVIHMDTCLMKRSLMIQCASYQIPELDFILVDDYWYSFVLSKYLSAKLIKIKLNNCTFDDFANSEDENIALYKQSSTTKQKNRFFGYHQLRGWPSVLSGVQEDYELPEVKSEISLLQNKVKTRQTCLNIYKEQFSGFNIGSGLYLNDLNHLVETCNCQVVRIGVVDKQRQFLSFFDKGGRKIVESAQIKTKLKKMNQNLISRNLKYIITLGNLPSKNQYAKEKGIPSQEWLSEESQQQLVSLWGIIAETLSTAPNCIGYDVVNEPIALSEHEKYKVVELYHKIIQEIRSVDQQTPIIIESIGGSYSQLDFMIGQCEKYDSNLIYSFHFYDPYVWTSARYRAQQDFYQYPGPIPESAGVKSAWSSNTTLWDSNRLSDIFRSVASLRVKYKLEDYQILMGEYGCRIDRKGIVEYFRDIIRICSSLKINRLAYAYREQWWRKMNYESNEEAFQVILEDIHQLKKSKSFIFSVEVFMTRKSQEAQWLDYNPFHFEIRQNKEKSLQKRIPYVYDFDRPFYVDLEPVFIVGCGRSGTTLLLKILSFCSEILCLHEPASFWLDIFPEFNIWSDEKYQVLHARQEVDPLMERRNKIKQIYQYLLKMTHKKIILDKQPQNVFKLDFLLKIFPKMKVIYIERPKEQVIESINRFTRDEWYGQDAVKFKILQKQIHQINISSNNMSQMQMAALQWQQSRKAWLRFKEEHLQLTHQMIEINFEELKGDPFKVIKRLGSFLNLDKNQTTAVYLGCDKILIKK